tara:strand:+ start:93 stop:356 length:264 start_codon:yes stop_codon:yes gene_type:complete
MAKTLLLVFQLVVIIAGPDAAIEQEEEMYFYSLNRCLNIADNLQRQQTRSGYTQGQGRNKRYRRNIVTAYCKPAYVFKEDKKELIWN